MLFEGGRNAVEHCVGAVLDETQQEGPFGNRELAEERAVAEDRGQQFLSGLGGSPGAGNGAAAVGRRFGERRLPDRETELAQPRVGRPRRHGIRSGEVQ